VCVCVCVYLSYLSSNLKVLTWKLHFVRQLHLQNI